jgi:hypothetical protein
VILGDGIENQGKLPGHPHPLFLVFPRNVRVDQRAVEALTCGPDIRALEPLLPGANLNLAASGICLTRSMVPNSWLRFTPLTVFP